MVTKLSPWSNQKKKEKKKKRKNEAEVIQQIHDKFVNSSKLTETALFSRQTIQLKNVTQFYSTQWCVAPGIMS